MSPTSPPFSAEDIARLRLEGIRLFGGDSGAKASEDTCVESALGAALNAAFLLSEDGRIDPLHLAAYLLYYIARNNCYLDGNKRAGWLAATDYLLGHGLRVIATQVEVYELVTGIADGLRSREQVLAWLSTGGRLGPAPRQLPLKNSN